MGNNIVMKSDQMEEVVGTANQASTQAMDASGAAGNNFVGLDSFFGGAGEISKQLGAINGSLDYVSTSIARNSGAQFERDGALANAADAIDVPMDFVTNEASRFTQYNQALLEKLDGRSVNEGNEVTIDDTLEGSMIGEEQRMGDITNENGTREEVYDDSSAIGKEQDMANITRAGGEEEQAYDERSKRGSQEAMGSIAKAGGEATQEYDGNSRVNEEMLANINKGSGVTEQKYNSNSKVNEETLVNINNGSSDAKVSELDLKNQARLNAQSVLNKFEGAQKEIAMPDLSVAGGAMKEAGGNGAAEVKIGQANGVNNNSREAAMAALDQLMKM